MTELKNISFESYENKVQINEITEMVLAQINESKKAIIEHDSPYSRSLSNGRYIHDKNSMWKVFDVNETDLGITRVVFWWESDDGSYSVHFKKDSLKPEFYCYEN